MKKTKGVPYNGKKYKEIPLEQLFGWIKGREKVDLDKKYTPFWGLSENLPIKEIIDLDKEDDNLIYA